MNNSGYPSDWNSRRKAVYQRDNYKCQNCGRLGGPKGTGELHAHHIVPKSKGGTHKKTNLKTICKQCHHAIHGDGMAPTEGQIHQKIQKGYFNMVAETMQNMAEIDGKVAMYKYQINDLLSGNSIDEDSHAQLEQMLLNSAFELKSDIRAKRHLDPPDEVTAGLQFSLEEIFDLAEEVVQGIVQFVESVQKIKEKATKEFETENCPNCGADVDTDSDFCGQCGFDVSTLGECPECGTPIEPENTYCTNCGTDLSGLDTASDMGSVELNLNQVNESSRNLANLGKKAKLYILRGTAATSSINPNESTKNIEWNYCPNCGFQKGVWVQGRNAKCVLCAATWKLKGFLSTEWKMISGKDVGKKYDDMTWNSRGKEMNENKRYEEIYQNTGPEEIESRYSRYT